MGQGRPVKRSGTKLVRVQNETHDLIKDFAASRSLEARQKVPRISEMLEDLLEIAFRCIEDHGADFSKPYREHKALEQAHATARRLGAVQVKRRPGRPRGSRDTKPRRRRA